MSEPVGQSTISMSDPVGQSTINELDPAGQSMAGMSVPEGQPTITISGPDGQSTVDMCGPVGQSPMNMFGPVGQSPITMSGPVGLSRIEQGKMVQKAMVEIEEEDAIRRLEEAVDIHTKEHKIEISPALVKEAIEAFKLFDKGNHQGLDIEELSRVFRALGQNPTDAELRDIIRKHDMNHNGRLEQDEFEHMILSYMKPMWQVKEELKDAFRIFDKKGSGTIAMAELEYVLKRYGEPLTHRQSRELITLMDRNGDGRVDMDDFVDFLCEVDRPDYFKTRYPIRRKSVTEHYK